MHGKDASNKGKQQKNNQPAQQKDERVAQHSNGDNDNGNSDSGDKDKENNYLRNGSQHQRLMAMAIEWMRMMRVQK